MKEQRSINLTDIASLFLAVYFIWYCLPFMRATFQSSLHKYVFFGCFAIGAALLAAARLQHNGMAIAFQAWHSILVPVVLYMIVMGVLFLCRIGDASEHIRVSFTFWGTAIIYGLFSFDKNAQTRFGKFLLLLFGITTITSVAGVFIDNSAARAIANASQREEAVARDYQLMRKNISGIYLFQCLVILVPVTVMMIRCKKKPVWAILLLIFIVSAILKASFTIPLLILFAGCGLALISNHKIPAAMILLLILLVLAVIPLDAVFEFLAEIIPNHYISARMEDVSVFFSQHSIQGDLQLRLRCYQYSLRAFFQNPLGVGPWYSYVVGDHGIGYHSEILDDLARYGVFAAGFYLWFFYEYIRMMKEQWSGIGLQSAVFPVCTVYALFLLLNIGFRSADESIFILYILPGLPDMLLSFGRDRQKVFKEAGGEPG
ncbi:MAG TPA: hypothetical protein H9672_08835 [Firmicutes bacterium]|nr:hypothetical protein [Bacillota bacterium]